MQEVVVLGGGVGGILVADLLARRLTNQQANITVITDSDQHYFQPGQLYVPFDKIETRSLKRLVRGLLDKRANLIHQRVVGLDHEDQWVKLESGKELHYDYLVIATGCALRPDLIPNLAETGHHFFSLGEAMLLRSQLKRFEGGRIVVGSASVPHKYPLGNFEFVFLLEEYLAQRGLKDVSEIVFVHPEKEPHKIESAARIIRKLFDRRGIKFFPEYRIRGVNPDEKFIISRGGSKVTYDLLVMTPPNRGVDFLQGHPIADRDGFVRVLPRTLQVKDADYTWAIGDATNLAVSKEASAAHFEARAVAEQIEAEIRGSIPNKKKAEYRGHVVSFLETGYGEATILNYTRREQPEIALPSEGIQLLKQGYIKSYWRLLTQGLI